MNTNNLQSSKESVTRSAMAPAATPAPSTAAGSPVPSKRTHSEAGSGDDEVIDEVCVPRFFPVRKVEEMRSLNTASPPSTRRFASKIVEVFVGEKKYHFSVHEAFLFESAELKSAYLSTPKSKRGKNSNMMYLPRDDPKEIGHLLEYLYLKKLTVNATSPKAQVEELLSIWAMGCKHGVADMQRLVIQKLEEFDIANKLPAMQFLKLADQLYESDVDFGLRRYFNTVAPRVVRKLASRDMTALLDIISEGGTFASDVFNAHHRAFRGASKGADTLRAPSPPPSNIKVEEGTVNRNTNTAKRARSEASEATPSSHADTAGASAGPDNLTEWDRENGIPSAWETAAPEDRLLTLMAQQGKSWNSISQAWERATGTKESINVLIHRLQRIEAVMVQLKPGDVSTGYFSFDPNNPAHCYQVTNNRATSPIVSTLQRPKSNPSSLLTSGTSSRPALSKKVATNTSQFACSPTARPSIPQPRDAKPPRPLLLSPRRAL